MARPIGLVVSLLVMIGLVGAGLLLGDFSSTENPTDTDLSENTKPTTELESSPASQAIIATAKSLSNQPVNNPKPHAHSHQTIPLRILPQTVQAEVNELNANDNSLAVIEQVSETEYRSSLAGIHRSVPVAVRQPDGSIAISEY